MCKCHTHACLSPVSPIGKRNRWGSHPWGPRCPPDHETPMAVPVPASARGKSPGDGEQGPLARRAAAGLGRPPWQAGQGRLCQARVVAVPVGWSSSGPPPALPGRHAPLLGSTLLPQGDRGPHRRQRRWRAWRWGARTALASCRDVELSRLPGAWAAGPALGPSQHCGGQRGRPGAEPRTPISRFPSRGLRTDAGSPDPSSVPQMPTPPRPLFKHTRAKPRALQGRSGSHGPRVLVSAPPGSPVRVC